MNQKNLGERFVEWAKWNPTIEALVMIGSRSRAADSYGACDEGSDWDFQVVTREPNLFRTAEWIADTVLGPPVSYVLREGRLRRVSKVSIVFLDGELDLVLIPSRAWFFLTLSVRLGLVRWYSGAADALHDLGAVWQGGAIVLKGRRHVKWLVKSPIFHRMRGRLDDEAVCAIANGFVYDYISAKRKVQRGEMLAAQRWLHMHLAEANFRLLHELRQRRGLVSFPDARRLEGLLSKEEMRLVRVEALIRDGGLRLSLERSADSCAELVRFLVGTKWAWPELPSSLSREKLRDDVF